jgi:Polyketide cyclase / dehydrase and lipid transport
VADEAVEEISIAASPERCFAVAVDFEGYPLWATDVKRAEVLDRDGAGRGSRVRYQVSALGRTIGYTLAYDRFDPAGDGTRVRYRLAVDLAIPLPGFVKRRAAGLIAENAMRGLKRHLEAAPG